MKEITILELKKKIRERKNFMIYFTKKTFHFFEIVQEIFFLNDIGWISRGCNLLELRLRKQGLILYFDGEDLSFHDIDDLTYYLLKQNIVCEVYILSSLDKKKKMFI